MTLRELHLFAGIGGGILAGDLLGHRCVGAVELDPYCRRVLEARQRDGVLPPFPIHGDVRTFDGRPWRGLVDVVCGGFPCQPWSSAGKRLGAADPRHLWPEMARIIGECRPRYVFAENVNIKAFEEPFHDLQRLGYCVPPALGLGAVDVGAPHRRNRWWLFAADSDTDRRRREGVGLEEHAGIEGAPRHEPDGLGASGRRHRASRAGGAGGARLPLPECEALLGPWGRQQGRAAAQRGWWSAEPRVGRVAHGIPARVDRLRALGNAQVPSVAAAAWRILYWRWLTA